MMKQKKKNHNVLRLRTLMYILRLSPCIFFLFHHSVFEYSTIADHYGDALFYPDPVCRPAPKVGSTLAPLGTIADHDTICTCAFCRFYGWVAPRAVKLRSPARYPPEDV